jgi:hypothetical protein
MSGHTKQPISVAQPPTVTAYAQDARACTQRPSVDPELMIHMLTIPPAIATYTRYDLC